jgi:transposase-like protein
MGLAYPSEEGRLEKCRGDGELVAMQRRPREFWVGLVQQFKGSGLTQAAFAAQQGVSDKTLSYWIGRVKKERQKPPAFLPVRMAKAPAPLQEPPAQPPRRAAVKAVLPDGLRLYFGKHASSRYVARVLCALRALPC